jgi:AcrR family transcriptional regulator
MGYAPQPVEITDRRVHAALRRRERTRSRLLESVLISYSDTPFGKSLSTEKVIANADVSKATFYKYFSSTEEAVQVLGEAIVGDMVEYLTELFSDEDRSSFKMVASMQVFLVRSSREPIWATFVSRADLMGDTSTVRSGIDDHIREARESGFLSVGSQDAAVALALGALEEGMRHLALNQVEDESVFVRDLMLLILRGLGADPTASEALLDETLSFMRSTRPSRLPVLRDSLTRLGVGA